MSEGKWLECITDLWRGYSTGLFRGMEYAFSVNFSQGRGLVRTFSIPVHERNAACRNVARVGSLLH